MNDKQLNALIVTNLQPAIAATSGLSLVKLARNFQQRQQGAEVGPIVYFVKLTDRRYGHTQRKDTYDIDEDEFTHVEGQIYESTYQFSAWIPQTPSDVNSLTESDVLNAVSSIIQSDTIITAFNAAGVGILRVTDVRNPYVVDDRDRFEAVPSFDIVLTHARTLVATVPTVTTYDANLYRV